MRSVHSTTHTSKHRRRFTTETLFRMLNQTTRLEVYRTFSTPNEHDQTNSCTNGHLIENDLRHLGELLSQMIRKRLLNHEPCLLPELGAFVLIDYPANDNPNLQLKEPFFVLDTTFARRHRLSRIKKPNLSSALSLSLQANGNSTHIEPNTTLSSFNMQTLDYISLQNQSGLSREQLMSAIAHIFAIIDKEINPHSFCDLEFPQLGHFKILSGLATFEFSDTFITEFKLTFAKNESTSPTDQ